MELQDDLEAETHIKMVFLAATIILLVVTGVVLIALGVFVAHCIYSACQGKSQWLCQLCCCTCTTGNVCPGTRRSPADNEINTSGVTALPATDHDTSNL